MKSSRTIAILLLALASTAARAETATPQKAKRAKPAAMSAEQRRDLERRIEALERKYEMQYRESESAPAGSGSSAPDAAPAPKPIAR